MSKSFWAIIAIIVLIFGGIIIFQGDKDKVSTDTHGAKPTQHTTGTNATNVTLVEYGDYQCPYCGVFHPTVKEVADKYKDKITFQFRNLPLNQIHSNAFAAARAAEAADKQGKFWEMHDALYETQNTWSKSSNPKSIFEQFAKQIGLNVTQFNKDADSAAINGIINADLAEFNKTGEDLSTPTFFLNGKRIQPNNTVEDFSKLIDAEIAKKAKS